MQKVYIELIFIDNFLMDLLILFLMMRASEKRVCLWRAALGAALGGAYAIFAVMIPPLRHIAIKLILSILMILITRGFGGVRRFLKSTAWFYGISMLAAGAIMLAEAAIGTPVNDSFVNLPMMRYILIGAVIAAVTAELILRRRQPLSRRIYLITASFGSLNISLKAVLDTGNSITDNAGCGVIVADMDYVLSQMDENDVCRIILNSEKRFYCRTAAGDGELTGILPDRITVNDEGRAYAVKGYIALAEDIGCRDHNALLPNNLRLI